jgi:rhodanese-related sulfurtransferase
LDDKAKIREAHPITLPNHSEPEPDIAIARPLGREYLQHHPYPENIFWLIEYSDSSLDKDLDIKRCLYAEVNIPEYWVVNLKTRTLIIFRDSQDGDYVSKLTLTEGTVYALPFPEIALAAEKIISF